MPHVRLVLLLILGALCLPAAAGAALTPQQALTGLNQWRTGLGLKPVAGTDPVMNDACRQANDYMLANGGLTHAPEVGKPGYTEAARAAAASSNLAQGATNLVDRPLLDVFEEGIYHRMWFQYPRLATTWFDTHVGAGSQSRMCAGVLDATLDGVPHPAWDSSPAGRAPALVAYPSPADGQTGVPLSFDGGESPDPRAKVPGTPAEIGWLLGITFNGPWAADGEATLTSGSLTPDGGGAAVPVTLQGTADGVSGFGVALFPHVPLAPGTTYTAKAKGTKRGSGVDYPFDVTWRFTTAPTQPTKLTWILSATERTINAGASSNRAPITATADQNGTVVASKTLSPDGEGWKTGLPAGTYRFCLRQPAKGTAQAFEECREATFTDPGTTTITNPTVTNPTITITGSSLPPGTVPTTPTPPTTRTFLARADGARVRRTVLRFTLAMNTKLTGRRVAVRVRRGGRTLRTVSVLVRGGRTPVRLGRIPRSARSVAVAITMADFMRNGEKVRLRPLTFTARRR